MGDEDLPRCIVSNPAQPHILSHQANHKVKHDCFACRESDAPWVTSKVDDIRYYCTICDVEFHRECHKFPSKMIHPYHPQHPLTFTSLNNETGVMADTNFGEFFRFLNRSKLELSFYLENRWPKSNIIFDTCTWCECFLPKWFYRCAICNFSLDILCATKTPSLTIQNPKNYHHSLALFPRPLWSPCDACGLGDPLEPSYECYQCNFIVHRSCIDLPRVIKITRHPHRLFHTPYLHAKVLPCRVCYKNVNIKYGQYSCNQEDCSYILHSKCATHEKIWDGNELEWEPEESVQDEAPFKRVGDGLIEHFCHNHHYLRLKKYDGFQDSGKKCEACIFPINSHDFYNCIECDFFLHEVCANLPRKLDHALHNHPLFIEPYPLYDRDYRGLHCSACLRVSTGFKYKCKEKGCNIGVPFQLDINCILVPECFTHVSHAEHPLFISLSFNNDDKIICHGCKARVGEYHLHCTICEFAICYSCGTIPNEICYKIDEKPLSLCYGESEVDAMYQYWCEVCEQRLDPTEWFYTNSESSCVTIHHKCLFGDSAYMKAGHTFDFYEDKVEVVSNGSSSRPICVFCNNHCQYSIYFKLRQGTTIADICSFTCSNGDISLSKFGFFLFGHTM